MVNCIKSGREVKEGQKRYVTNIRGSEKVADLEEETEVMNNQRRPLCDICSSQKSHFQCVTCIIYICSGCRPSHEADCLYPDITFIKDNTRIAKKRNARQGWQDRERLWNQDREWQGNQDREWQGNQDRVWQWNQDCERQRNQDCEWQGNQDRVWQWNHDREWQGNQDRERQGNQDCEQQGNQDREWQGNQDRERQGNQDRVWQGNQDRVWQGRQDLTLYGSQGQDLKRQEDRDLSRQSSEDLVQMMGDVRKKVTEAMMKLTVERRTIERDIHNRYATLLSHAEKSRDHNLLSMKEAMSIMTTSLVKTDSLAQKTLNKASKNVE
ncbi:hypothetical protein ACOMHN_023528 [Nucella lapillus]